MSPIGAGAAGPAGAGASGERRKGRWALFGGICLVVVVLDQLTKAWVDGAVFPGAEAAPGAAMGPAAVLGDLVRISRVTNRGGIFGLFGDSAPLLALASLVVVGGILWYQARQGSRGGPILTIALGLLLGGALGNLIDRLRLGYVVDWVDTGIGSLRWYTFNVADAAISLGIVLLIVGGLLGDRSLSSLVHRGATPPAPQA